MGIRTFGSCCRCGCETSYAWVDTWSLNRDPVYICPRCMAAATVNDEPIMDRQPSPDTVPATVSRENKR